MQDYEFSLASGESKRFSVVGNTLRYKEGGAEMRFQAGGGTVTLKPGQQITDTTSRFSEFTVKNAGTGLVSGVVLAGDLDFKDDQFTGTVNVSNVNAASTHSNTAVTNAAGGVTLLAANAQRRYLFIQNNDAADSIRVTTDGSTPTATHGIKIGPGGVYEPPFVPNGIIKALSGIASNANVEVVEA